MGVLTQHRQQGSEIRLKTLAHAVELIAPKARGVDQQQRLQGKRQAHQHPQQRPASAHTCVGLKPRHRRSSSRCQRSRRSSSPNAGPGRPTLSNQLSGRDGCLLMPPAAPPTQQWLPHTAIALFSEPTNKRHGPRHQVRHPVARGLLSNRPRSTMPPAHLRLQPLQQSCCCCSRRCCCRGNCNRAAKKPGSAAPATRAVNKGKPRR